MRTLAVVRVLSAPAKINATLEILSRRDDGYHTLRSVMLPIGLYDRIALEPSTVGGFTSSDASLATDNLVARALAAAGLDRRYVATLEKTIPVGGGLGGGSSDAAAVLLAAMRGELGAQPERDWLDVARRLGSDVPFFLCGTAALVEGTGERVTALGALPPWWTLVVRPHVAVGTAEAYRLLDARRADGRDVVESRPRATSASLAVVDALQRGAFDAFSGALQNDFHAPVLAAFPAVARAHAAMRAAGAGNAMLSGSGSCLFATFSCEADARATAARLAPEAIAARFVAPLHRDAAWR